jgi:hypothetical protein
MAARAGNQAWRQRGKTALCSASPKSAFSTIRPAAFYGAAARLQGAAIPPATASFGMTGDGSPTDGLRCISTASILVPNEAGHVCPAGPNTLCVQHLAGQTKADNVAERNTRVARENAKASKTR